MAANNNIQDVLAYLGSIDVDALKKDAGASDVLTLLYAARKLVRELESPFQHVHHVTTHATQISHCLLILDDLGVWESWRTAAAASEGAGGGGGRGDQQQEEEDKKKREASLTELWERCVTPCDIALLRRFLAMMAANGIIEEAAEEGDRWRPTALSLALGDKDSTAYHALMWWKKVSDPSCRNLPGFLTRTAYQNPLDPARCNFMDVTGPDRLDCWQLFARDPELRRNFGGYMRGQLEYRLDWTEVYDVAGIADGWWSHNDDDDDDGDDDGGGNSSTTTTRSFAVFHKKKKLLVDIGGSHGHDLDRVLARMPDLPAGCLVLQDLPNVLADAGDALDKRIVKMPYDFFEPQPVVGSRAYLLHWVLHDWNDTDARRILANVAAAMEKGYSKLLVCDYSMPSRGATRAQTSSDFAMMHLLSAADRTETSWLALLRGVGFEVLKIWKHAVSGDSVFEAVLLAT